MLHVYGLERLVVVLLLIANVCMHRGLSAGIYTTNSPEACQYIIEDCSANVVICQNNDKLQRILAVRALSLIK